MGAKTRCATDKSPILQARRQFWHPAGVDAHADEHHVAVVDLQGRPDYSGGYGKYHKVYWKTFGSVCGRYDGPAIAAFGLPARDNRKADRLGHAHVLDAVERAALTLTSM